ncbi:chorismate mutase [Streptomyces sp. NPDC017940]|uniref:chorismate mutase n=1 Tax=Streptomyces sp. NPDC017940 TaxID=3365017 RepID=UPI003794D395
MTEIIEHTTQIEESRTTIDSLDTHIIKLLTRRAEISAAIQKIRTGSGGPRTVFTREMDILAHYRRGLGEHGTHIAMDVLKLCRGAGTLQPCPLKKNVG